MAKSGKARRICKPAPKNARCFYYGASATGFDHVIPYSVCGENTDKVTCCQECNCLLGATIYDDVWEKKSYIAKALPKRYSDILKMKLHCVIGLEGDLAAHVEHELDRKEFILGRIEFALNNPIDKSNAFDSESAEKPLRDYLLSQKTYL